MQAAFHEPKTKHHMPFTVQCLHFLQRSKHPLIACWWQLFQERRALKGRCDQWELYLPAEVSGLQTQYFPSKPDSGPFQF